MHLPLGFKDEEQFDEAVRRFREASGVGDAVIGVRGSAATGQSAQTGADFGAKSDIDFFLVSDSAYAAALALGANSNNGALRVGATQRYLPALNAVEKALSIELSRKTTIRIFSCAGYDLMKAATDISRSVSMEIYFKTDLGLDALAQKLRETLNLPERNHVSSAVEQKRFGVNYGGDYYSFEAFGVWLNLLKNTGEVAIPERADYSYYLVTEADTETDWETVDCMTRQIYTMMRRTGLEMELS